MSLARVCRSFRPDALRAEMEQCFGDGYAAARSENALESVDLVEQLRVELAEARAVLARLGADVQRIAEGGIVPRGGYIGDASCKNLQEAARSSVTKGHKKPARIGLDGFF